MEQVINHAVREPVDGSRSVKVRHSERRRDVLVEDAAGLLDIERLSAAQEVVRVKVAKNRVDVGHRWVEATVVIADRAGVGARAPRANLWNARAGLNEDD